jgi:hypothetical protein
VHTRNDAQHHGERQEYAQEGLDKAQADERGRSKDADHRECASRKKLQTARGRIDDGLACV